MGAIMSYTKGNYYMCMAESLHKLTGLNGMVIVLPDDTITYHGTSVDDLIINNHIAVNGANGYFAVCPNVEQMEVLTQLGIDKINFRYGNELTGKETYDTLPDSTFDGIQNKSDIVLYRIGVFFDNEKSSCNVIACNVLDEMQHHPDFYLWLTDDSFAFDQGTCNFLHRNRLTLSDLSGFTLKYKCALVRAGTYVSLQLHRRSNMLI
jgi:hypothetical protein